MIVARAPLRISFVGGGTDLPQFYKYSQGQVISTTIDKYIYIAIKRTPLIAKISARYKISETVDLPKQLRHSRIRAALLDLKIKKGIEIGSFGDLPGKTGLGSSSSFAVALLKGLHAYLGKKLNPEEAAESACRLEIDLLGEPIGKQDQYAAAYGGLNIIEFHTNGKVKVKPVLLDFTKKREFENHLLVFFTGITRDASTVLKEQNINLKSKLKIMKRMAATVPVFAKHLLQADFAKLGQILHEAWLDKKSLAKAISSSVIDELYLSGKKAGAWGGKILGAGGGGCLLFIVPVDKKKQIKQTLLNVSEKKGLKDFREIPVRFVQSGGEILFNADQYHDGKLY